MGYTGHDGGVPPDPKVAGMALDFEGKTPLYEQLAQILREQIAAGEIPPGRRLPSKLALRQEYGVSQNTVERALDLLRGAGLIETSLGRGLYVTEPGDRPPP